jgi:NADPH-dependent curcumin reductase CurA
MNSVTGREVRLAKRPNGAPRPTDFEVVTVETPAPSAGQVLLKTRWISVDPMIRIAIDANPLGGGVKPLPIGAAPPGPAVAEVIASAHPDYKVGDIVQGRLGWRDHLLSDGAGLQRVDPGMAPLSHFLGVLGLPGFSAYVGLKVCGELGPGQTVLVSGAAGAVGSLFGPLAKLTGADVVGIASGEARCRALTETLSYDRAVDRAAPDFEARLAAAVPSGVDLYFENVGGPMFDQVLPLLNLHGRVTICGLMAQYVDDGEHPGPDRLPGVLERMMARGLTLRAFRNGDFPQLREPFLAEVGALLREGKLAIPEHVTEGIENVPAAFCRLFSDTVVGKSVVRV